MIGLLRGVNVGGHNKLPMAELRELCTGCGFDRATTYIQSGNVVFTAAVGPAKAAELLGAALAEHMGKPIDVTVRTAEELAQVSVDNPFLARGEDADALHVAFGIGPDPLQPLGDLTGYAPEEAIPVGRQLYFFLPNGLGRSKLVVDLGRRKGPPGTMRNWRTVNKLLDLAAELG